MLCEKIRDKATWHNLLLQKRSIDNKHTSDMQATKIDPTFLEKLVGIQGPFNLVDG